MCDDDMFMMYVEWKRERDFSGGGGGGGGGSGEC